MIDGIASVGPSLLAFEKSAQEVQRASQNITTGINTASAIDEVVVEIKENLRGFQSVHQSLKHMEAHLEVQSASLSNMQTMTNRLETLALFAQDPLLAASDREVLEDEFQSVKAGVGNFSLFTFSGTVLIDNPFDVNTSLSSI